MAEENKIEIQAWVAFKDLDKYPQNKAGHLGGWVKGENFDEYLERYDESVHKYLIAIKEYVIAHQSYSTGEEHQYSSNGIPLFTDGTISAFSWRGWGDLMAAIKNSDTGTQDYQYMDFYM